jgi:hypothetical protein
LGRDEDHEDLQVRDGVHGEVLHVGHGEVLRDEVRDAGHHAPKVLPNHQGHMVRDGEGHYSVHYVLDLQPSLRCRSLSVQKDLLHCRCHPSCLCRSFRCPSHWSCPSPLVHQRMFCGQALGREEVDRGEAFLDRQRSWHLDPRVQMLAPHYGPRVLGHARSPRYGSGRRKDGCCPVAQG